MKLLALLTVLGTLACATAAQAADQVAVAGEDGIRVVTVARADAATLARLERADGVDFAEAGAPTRGAAATGFAAQWALENTGQTGGTFDADVDAPGAWALAGTGRASVTVGFADTGIAFDHPGLSGAAFAVDAGETGVDAQGRDRATNGVDDDGDGCVDDVRGCDELDHWGSAVDANGHGTGTAGVVAARGAYDGVAPGVAVAAARVLDAQARGTTAALAAGMDRLAREGARVVNVSVTGPSSDAVHRAITSHPETLFVVAAGNDAADVDAAPTFPCADPAANVICVGATNARDALASFSNSGATSVDLAAPGAALAGLTLDGTTTNLNGTSFAAPVVSGIAALAFSAKPDATVADVRRALLGGVDVLPALAGEVATGGRANAHRTVAALLGVPFAERDVAPASAAAATPAAVPGAAASAATASIATPAAATPRRAAAPAARPAAALTATARRRGARKLVVELRCAAGAPCGTVKVTAAGRTGTAKVAAGQRRTVTLTVRRARGVRRVTLTTAARTFAITRIR